MASKTKVTPQKEEMLEKEGPETPPFPPNRPSGPSRTEAVRWCMAEYIRANAVD
jgi:hypothetical protein